MDGLFDDIKPAASGAQSSAKPAPPRGMFDDIQPLKEAETPGILSVAGQAGMRGLIEGGTQVAQAANPFKDRPQEQQGDYVGQLLQKPISEGWNDPKWWAANIAHGTAETAPSLVTGGLGMAAGTAAAGPVGGLVGGAGGFALGSMVQTIAPAYQRARSEGLPHDAAVDRALMDTGIAGAFGAAMGLAPGMPVTGTVMKEGVQALKRPVSEALAQIFGVQPAIGAAQQEVEGLAHGKAPTADELATGYAGNVGAGLALTAGHRAYSGLRGEPAPPGQAAGTTLSPDQDLTSQLTARALAAATTESRDRPAPLPLGIDVLTAIKSATDVERQAHAPGITPEQKDALLAQAKAVRDQFGTPAGKTEGAEAPPATEPDQAPPSPATPPVPAEPPLSTPIGAAPRQSQPAPPSVALPRAATPTMPAMPDAAGPSPAGPTAPSPAGEPARAPDVNPLDRIAGLEADRAAEARGEKVSGSPAQSFSGIEQGARTAAEPLPSSSSGQGASIDGGIVYVDPSQIGIDPKRFQFRSDIDDRGTSGRLKGITQWQPTLADPLIVYRDAEGKLWVADGHHRLALANDLNAEGRGPGKIPAFVLDAAQGYTPGEVRLFAAYKNLANGHGSAIDAAKVMRESKVAKADLGLPELPDTALVKQGKALSNLSDEGFGMVVNGIVEPEHAAVVPEYFRDPKEQDAAIRALAKFEPQNVTQARSMLADMKAAGMEHGESLSLFGTEQQASSLIGERARILDNALRVMRKTSRTFGTASVGHDILAAAGNTLDRAANQKGKSENDRLIASIAADGNRRGPISDALSAAARDLKSGKSVGTVTADFLNAARKNLGREAQGDVPAGADHGRVGAEAPPENQLGLHEPPKMSKADFDKYIADLHASQRETAERVVPAIERGDRVFAEKGAHRYVVSREPSTGALRLTSFDGASPTGHFEVRTPEEAAKEIWALERQGYETKGPAAKLHEDRPTIDTTDQGEQRVIPGAERMTPEEMARRKAVEDKLRAEIQMQARKRGAATQRSVDETPLFGGKGKQGTLFDGDKPADIRPLTATNMIADFVRHAAAALRGDTNPHAINMHAASYVTQRGKETGFEFAAVYDPSINKVVSAATDGREKTVNIPQFPRTESDSVIIHHNHPSSRGLSAADISALGYRGIGSIIAHGTDGEMSAARLTPEAAALKARAGYIAPKFFKHAAKTAGDTIIRIWHDGISSGRISLEQANRFYADAVGQALHAAGLIDHIVTRDLSEIPDIYYRTAVRAAARDVTETVERTFPASLLKDNPDALVIRPSGTIRPAEGLARLLGGIDAPSRQEGPERAAGDRQREGADQGPPAPQPAAAPGESEKLKPSVPQARPDYSGPTMPLVGRQGALFEERDPFERAPPFFSALTKGVSDLNLAKAHPSQWLGTLDGLRNKGVKEEELAWSGVRDWLKDQKGLVTKEQVLDHLRQNEVQIKEVMKGAGTEGERALTTRLNNFLSFDASHALMSPKEREEHAIETDVLSDLGLIHSNGRPAAMADGNWRLTPKGEEAMRGEEPTKYGDRPSLMLPGGENYREMLLTMPEPPKSARFRDLELKVNRGDRMSVDEREEYYRLAQEGLARETFTAGHFGEPNVLAHVRMNDRTGPNGEKILHVEEIQSDWHQKGRREGYRGKASPVGEVRYEPEKDREYPWGIYVNGVEQNRNRGDRERAEASLSEELARATRKSPGTPNAPLKTTWHEMALKRVIRHAAENGYDKVTWTTGDQQAERYDLSKQIQRLIYSDGELTAFDHNGKQIMQEDVAEKDLPDHIGKDAADKLLSAPDVGTRVENGQRVPWREISGLDLKIEHKGMKGFYDKMLPAAANKIAKPFGARVGEGEIQTAQGHGKSWSVYDPRGDHVRNFESMQEAYRYQEDPSNGLRNGRVIENKEITPKTEPVHSLDITDSMRESAVQKGFALFEERDPFAHLREENETIQRASSRVSEMLHKAADHALDLSHELQMKATPMARGNDFSRASSKDFANATRESTWDTAKQLEFLKKNFTPDQLRRMWEAADEQSVAMQSGQPTEGIGLARLSPVEREIVQALQDRANYWFNQAREAGMHDSPGLPSYAPRKIVNIVEGQIKSVGSEGGTKKLDVVGQNLRTSTGHLKHREHLTTEQTEAAAQEKFGEGATVVRDIRTLASATGELQRAVAGRKLINRIKEYGHETGADTVTEGAQPANDPHWFTIENHAAFWINRPEMRDRAEPGPQGGTREAVLDDQGNPVFRRVPLYVRDDFEGPLRAVLSRDSGKIYNALMDLKSKTMGVIMYSPLIHNAVEWGRALPAMPGKVATFKIYFEGNAAKHDTATMREAIQAGLVPIGHRYGGQDISSILEEGNIAPGRSWTAKLLGAVPGLFDPRAGDAVKRAVDKMGDFWHNVLLWDRVGDLQMGLFTNLRDQKIKAGVDPQTAQRYAAHFANRYAGALPLEAMSSSARKIANLALFSRTFTLGNLGAMKDMVAGLPRDVQSQILRDKGTEALQNIQSSAKRKAIATIAMDVALMYVGNSMLQSGIAILAGDSSLDKEAQGYARRFNELMMRGKESPVDLLNPLDDIKTLTAQGENEPGKQDRVLVGYSPAPDSQAIYMRNPAGKIGEEMIGWLDPLDQLKRKLGTIARPAFQLASNDQGFGRKVYDDAAHTPTQHIENLGRVMALFLGDQIPLQSLQAVRDLYAGRGNSTVEQAQILGPFFGLTFSKGAPGGPAVGELYHDQEAHRFKVQQALPDIRKMIQDGDVDGAVKKMTALGIDQGLQKFYIRTTENPESRLSKRAMKDFDLYGTPDQKRSMERFQQQP